MQLKPFSIENNKNPTFYEPIKQIKTFVLFDTVCMEYVMYVVIDERINKVFLLFYAFVHQLTRQNVLD